MDSQLVNEETHEKGIRFCREYLGGSWADLSLEDFHMEHISGGLSNLLYSCELSDKIPTQEGEPRKVLLRLYGQIIRENPEVVLTDSVIFALLSEKTMGPKLYGIFTEGRLEEYVPSRHLLTEELRRADISVACAEIMANFHQLKMPMVKEPRWLFETITRYLEGALNNVALNHVEVEKSRKLQRLLSFGLKAEMQCLRKILSQVHSPVVFCHNDLQEGNILFVEEGSHWQVRPIDFEYASYSYRGFDIGNHFCEWCFDYTVNQPPYFSANLDNYPTREQQLMFIRAYMREEALSGGGDYVMNGDAEEAMLLEVNTYALASHFLWGLWSVVQSHISKIRFGYLDYALARFDAYFKQKKMLPSSVVLNGT